MLIGPLDKTRVEQFNLLPRSIPALVLNYLPPTTAPTPSLLQLGLAVEDEALAIGRRLAGEGHERIVVLHNEQGWSLRARDALLRSIDEQTIIAATQTISLQN